MAQEKPLDTSAAEGYEKYIVPAFMLPLVKGVIEAAKVRPGEQVLDVACGTGLVARQVAPLAAPGGSVTVWISILLWSQLHAAWSSHPLTLS